MNTLQRLKDLTQPTGEEDLLNVDYPTPRFTIEPRVALIAAASLVVLGGGWWFWHSPAVNEPASDSIPWAEAVVTSAEEQPAQIVVSVVGRVENPGLVTVAPGQRIANALDIAVAMPDADTATLNLAQVLVDGQQIYVPAQGEMPAVTVSEEGISTTLISLNSASSAELQELNGVGEATAAAIIAYREDIGGFTDVEQLLDVSGIGPAKFARIKEQVSL